MVDHLYGCLQDEDKIVGFAIDPSTGGVTRQADVPVAGGPSVLDRRRADRGSRAGRLTSDPKRHYAA